MSMIKVFLKDFITKDKIKWYIIALIIFVVFLIIVPLEKFSSTATAGIIGVMICFFPTMYTIYTYAVPDNIRLYLTLPQNSRNTIFSFCIALFAITLIERISFVCIAIFFLFENPIPTIIFVVFSGITTVLLNVVILLGMNTKKVLAVVLGILLFAGLVIISIMKFGLFQRIGLTLLIGLIGALISLKHNSLDLAINRQSTTGSNLGHNYFFSVLATEKMYLLNTGLVLVFAAVFLFFFAEPGNPIMLSVVWCVAAVNTPVTTMISGDKWLIRQAEMLPDSNSSIFKMYQNFLISYFTASNLIILILSLIRAGSFVSYLIVQFVILIIFEVMVSLYLEKKKRITDWQTKQQLWRNPRKYILPVMVFIISVAIGMIADLIH